MPIAKIIANDLTKLLTHIKFHEFKKQIRMN